MQTKRKSQPDAERKAINLLRIQLLGSDNVTHISIAAAVVQAFNVITYACEHKIKLHVDEKIPQPCSFYTLQRHPWSPVKWYKFAPTEVDNSPLSIASDNKKNDSNTFWGRVKDPDPQAGGSPLEFDLPSHFQPSSNFTPNP